MAPSPICFVEDIFKGGGACAGQMLAFKNSLSQADFNAAIASFQKYWTEELYEDWLTMDKNSRP